jgi:hypothetical protein
MRLTALAETLKGARRRCVKELVMKRVTTVIRNRG